jgi:hypothetical protein
MKGQFLTAAVIGAVAIGSVVSSSAAEAATLVTNNGNLATGTITGINALQVDSTTYNVSFSNGSYNGTFGTPTFLNNQAGAGSAVDAINSFLTSTGRFGNVFLGNANIYRVPFALSNNLVQAFESSGQSSSNPWAKIVVSNIALDDSKSVYAVFAAVPAAAVPTPALLPGLIGMGVATLQKRNKAEAVSQDA